jgi:hypothetical protein
VILLSINYINLGALPKLRKKSGNSSPQSKPLASRVGDYPVSFHQGLWWQAGLVVMWSGETAEAM